MELRVGQRVKVVAPDPTSGNDEFIGCTGEIVDITSDTIFPFWVVLDADASWDTTGWPFCAAELEVLDGGAS